MASERLLRGDFQAYGTYREDRAGFELPELQDLLVDACGRAGVDPRALGSGGVSAGGGVGGAEHCLPPHLPRWLEVFQHKAERAGEWGETEAMYGRLLGAFYQAWFLDRFYAPHGLALPANVEVFFENLGKSNPSGFRPGYVGNGAATFEAIGGGGPSYAAAASSKAFLRGLARYGWQTEASGYAPGGKGVGHGCRVFARPGGKAGEELRPLPGDVVSLRTALSPLSGHVATVAWAETDGTASGSIWFVSGCSAHAAVSCDWAEVVPGPGKPASGTVSIALHWGNSALQPDRLEAMPLGERARRRCRRKLGKFPPAPRAGARSVLAGGATAVPALAEDAPAAPPEEESLASGTIASVPTVAEAPPIILRLGSHEPEPGE